MRVEWDDGSVSAILESLLQDHQTGSLTGTDILGHDLVDPVNKIETAKGIYHYLLFYI